MDEKLLMFKELTEANGIPGNEKQIRKIMKKHIEEYADKIYTDNIGSLIAEKVGCEDGPKIMISGHMDEIGFIVTSVDDKGFISFQTLGGWNGKNMLAQRVTITNSKGEEFIGVIWSSIADSSSDAYTKIDNLYIDMGVESREEVEKLGIKCGDMITPYAEFTPMANPKYLLAKAWDDRVGVALCIDVLKALKNEKHPNRVYAVGTVQEEVGLRGAKTAANKVKPDIGFSLDVGLYNDIPGSNQKAGKAELGKGPEITIRDASMIGHTDLREFVIGICDELNIPYQLCALPFGGTDAGQMHLSHDGAPSMFIALPTRYIHSNQGILHRDDYDNAVKIVTEVIKRLDRESYERILWGE